MNIISGLYNEGQIRVGIVATRFNGGCIQAD